MDGGLVTGVSRQKLARLGVPQFGGSVIFAGCQFRAVGRVGDRPNVTAVSFPGLHELAATDIPDSHRLVPADRCQPPSVAIERQSVDRTGVSFQG